MRRFFILILCVFMLTTVVFAENTVSKAENFSALTPDGNCQVNLNVTIRIDTADTRLVFPLPKGAKNVMMNGSSVRTSQSPDDENAVLVDLSYLDNAVGEYTLSFQYFLSGVVKPPDKKDKPDRLELPLLSGFKYPVQQMQFAVTLPDTVPVTPNFSSGYLHQSIESKIEVVVKDNMVSGTVKSPLQDHETLSMLMDAPEGMFTVKPIFQREGNPELAMMAACGVLALIYWLLTMRAVPLFPQNRIEPLDGVTAGELGCRLSLVGVDLTSLVMTWAKLGYLRIELDRRGRVFLHKRMEMGNERDAVELQLFRSLFGKSRTVDGTGLHYAKLAQKAAHTLAGSHEILRKSFSCVRIFRYLAAAISLFSGVCLAMNLTAILPLQIVLALILAVLGFITALRIQDIAARLFLRNKMPVYVGLGCAAVWVVLGAFAGQPTVAILAVIAQLIAGFAASYGGRRTEQGRLEARLILGLRRYFKAAPTQELNRIMIQNPNYFFEMAPYAMALGVDKAFAKRFGKLPQPQCPYLKADVQIRLNTEEWAMLLRETAAILDARYRRMELQRQLPWLARISRPKRRPKRQHRTTARRRPNHR